MDLDINSRNSDNYIEIGGKPHKRVVGVDSSGNLVNPATSDNQTNGSQIVKVSNTLITVPFDYIGATYPNTSTEVYTYKIGGSGGTTVGTITVVYSDAGTKQIISSVTKS